MANYSRHSAGPSGLNSFYGHSSPPPPPLPPSPHYQGNWGASPQFNAPRQSGLEDSHHTLERIYELLCQQQADIKSLSEQVGGLEKRISSSETKETDKRVTIPKSASVSTVSLA